VQESINTNRSGGYLGETMPFNIIGALEVGVTSQVKYVPESSFTLASASLSLQALSSFQLMTADEKKELQNDVHHQKKRYGDNRKPLLAHERDRHEKDWFFRASGGSMFPMNTVSRILYASYRLTIGILICRIHRLGK
jgi:hypothetical protein